MAKSAPADVKSLAAAMLVAVMVHSLPAAAAPPPHVGAQAPRFELPLIFNGSGTLSLAALRGRPVYLNFFASWCQPCREEAGRIAKLATAYGVRGLIVIGVDELENRSRALAFAKEFKLPYAIAVDPTGSVGGHYGLTGLPLQVFIASDGTIAMWQQGPLDFAVAHKELQLLAKPY